MHRTQASFLHKFRLNPSQLGNAAATGKVPQALKIFASPILPPPSLC
jgi:hypothetical protein